MRHLPHTDEEIRDMLAVIRRGSLDELFCSVPDSCRYEGEMPLPPAMDEWQLTEHMEILAAAMAVDDKARVLIGAGSYHHHIPETIRAIISRGELLTAYTPYQPEMAQGTLQGIYEYQTLTSRLLVTAPGLSAQEVAARIEGYPTADIPARHLGKGIYFRLTGPAPFNRLIYPPPIPGALGTHYRKDLGGQGVFGPDLAYVETEDYSVDPAKAEEFARYIRRFWPGVTVERLTPDYAGIRPKLHGPGEPQPDFQLHGVANHGMEGLMALFGIESPGLTSSLAIGEAVAQSLTAGV